MVVNIAYLIPRLITSFKNRSCTGGSEAPGPRGLGGGGRRRPTHPGPRGPERRMGSGGGPAQPARPGLELPRVGGRRDLRTPACSLELCWEGQGWEGGRGS